MLPESLCINIAAKLEFLNIWKHCATCKVQTDINYQMRSKPIVMPNSLRTVFTFFIWTLSHVLSLEQIKGAINQLPLSVLKVRNTFRAKLFTLSCSNTSKARPFGISQQWVYSEPGSRSPAKDGRSSYAASSQAERVAFSARSGLPCSKVDLVTNKAASMGFVFHTGLTAPSTVIKTLL